METAGYDKLGPYRDVFYSALFTFLESQRKEESEEP